MKVEILEGQHTFHPDEYRAWPRIGMALLAILLFFGVQVFTVLWVGKEDMGTLWIPGLHAVAAIPLIALATLQCRQGGTMRTLAGTNIVSSLKIFLPIVLCLYIACNGLNLALGIPRESFMIHLFDGLSVWQSVFMVLGVMVFPPVTEELIYRHFLFRMFPVHKVAGAWAAVLFTATAFSWNHSQYTHWTTTLLLAALGITLTIARLKTGGILVPVLMHSFAAGVAIVLSWMIGYWG